MWRDEFQELDLRRFARGACVRFSQKEKSKTTTSTGYTPAQTKLGEAVMKTYSPYLGQGTLGGLSDLEESSLDMLRNADVWAPLSTAGTGLLTGSIGAQPYSMDEAGRAFSDIVEAPTMREWNRTFRPQIKEAYSGPGYWSSARSRAETEGMKDLGNWLGTERSKWMWNTEQANRAIQEAKAGRALSALGVVPSSLLGWTGGLFGTGAQAREILNQITDPQVLRVLEGMLGRQLAPTVTRGEKAPSKFQQGANWGGVGLRAAMAAFGGGAGAGGSALGAMGAAGGSPLQSYVLGGYGGGL